MGPSRKSAFPAFFAFFLLPSFRRARRACGNPENADRRPFPQISSDLLKPPSLKPSFSGTPILLLAGHSSVETHENPTLLQRNSCLSMHRSEVKIMHCFANTYAMCTKSLNKIQRLDATHKVMNLSAICQAVIIQDIVAAPKCAG